MIIREPKITSRPAYDQDAYTEWSYTQQGIDVSHLRQQRERKAGVPERPPITRDSPIDGRVYEGAYGGEAIVVDTEKYPLVNKAVEAILEQVTVNGAVDKGLILDTVYAYVSQHMRYDAAAVDKIFAEDCEGVDGRKISLDTYIQDGVGVCRHQALFAGAVMEQLAKRGVVHGTASVERNLVRSGADGKHDGHSWLRYTNSAGEVYIMDVAQHKLDTLDNLMRQRREGEKLWDYGRTEDHDKLRGAFAVETADLAMTLDLSGSVGVDGPTVIDKIPDWVMNQGTAAAENEKAASQASSEQLLRSTKRALIDITNHMLTGTVDGYVLSHLLEDESRKLVTVDHDLSVALAGVAREASQQASDRYGFSNDLVAHIRRLAAAI